MLDIKPYLNQLKFALNKEEINYINFEYENFLIGLDEIRKFDLNIFQEHNKRYINCYHLPTIDEFANITYEKENLFINSSNFIDNKIILNNKK